MKEVDITTLIKDNILLTIGIIIAIFIPVPIFGSLGVVIMVFMLFNKYIEMRRVKRKNRNRVKKTYSY
jgi:cation transport ATPase